MVYFYRPFFPCANCEGRRYVALWNFPLFQLPQIRIFSQRRISPTPSTCFIIFKREIKFNARIDKIQLLFCLGFVRYHAVSEGGRVGFAFEFMTKRWIPFVSFMWNYFDFARIITNIFHSTIKGTKSCSRTLTSLFT